VSLFFQGRLVVAFVILRRAFLESTNVSLGAVLWSFARTHHLGKEIYIIICFARHRLANLVQHGQKLRPAINDMALDLGLRVRDCQFLNSLHYSTPIGNELQTTQSELTISNSEYQISTYDITFEK
jgi:hypothetical protein